jgi:hypothetical protein
VSRESTNAGFTQHLRRHRVRSPFRDRTPHDVHRFALSPSFAASAARTTSFRLGRHRSPFEGREDGRDVSDRRLLPDSSTTSTRASSVPVRVSSHGALDVFTTSLALRRVIQKVRGEFSSPDCALRFEVPHLTTTEPLTPLSLPSIRGVALCAQSRARRRLPRPLLQPARETQTTFTIRGAFPRTVAHRAPSGPRFRDGRSRPATRRFHDFAAVTRRKRRRFARPSPEGDCPLARTITLKKQTLSARPCNVSPRCFGITG